MNIISARNPAMTEHGGVELLVTFERLGEVPFHAKIDDVEAHGRDIYSRAMSGEFGPVAPYAEPVAPLADLATAKLEAIQAEKTRVRDGGFIHAGVRYDSDAEARLAYLELATRLAQDSTYSTPWKASAGAWVQMDAALFSALKPAYEAHISACFAWQGAREQEIAAALAMVTPALGPSTPALDEFGNQLFDENGAEIWNPGEPTGELDESAARAALSAVAETM